MEKDMEYNKTSIDVLDKIYPTKFKKECGNMPYLKLETNYKFPDEEEVVKGLSNSICKYLMNNYGINPDRVYINFTNVERHMWGWNNGTF